MGTGDILQRGNPAMDWHPVQGGVAILSVASCYGNWDKLWPCGPPWPECDFILLLFISHSVLQTIIRMRSDVSLGRGLKVLLHEPIFPTTCSVIPLRDKLPMKLHV